MLPSRHRMRRSDEFSRTVRGGSRAGGPHLVVHLLVPGAIGDHPDLEPTRVEPARVGFVVSKAVGGAVQRNLVKRRLREIVGHRLGDLPSGALVVIRALPAASRATHEELSDGVGRCLEVAARRERRRPRDEIAPSRGDRAADGAITTAGSSGRATGGPDE